MDLPGPPSAIVPIVGSVFARIFHVPPGILEG